MARRDDRIMRQTDLEALWDAAYRLGFRHGEAEAQHHAANKEERDIRIRLEVDRQLTDEGLDDA